MIDGLGNASYVAREVVKEKKIEDYTVQESPSIASPRSSVPVWRSASRLDGLAGAGTALRVFPSSYKEARPKPGFFIWNAGSGDFDAFLEEHVDQADQRQSHQAGGVLSFGGAEQADAQAFRLEAAGAVQRAFRFDVAADAALVEVAEVAR